MEKQIIMVVQAAPKTQPGGVQGALFKLAYHAEDTPELVNLLPKYNAPKFNNKKMIILNIMV